VTQSFPAGRRTKLSISGSAAATGNAGRNNRPSIIIAEINR
jgi:hypothetical protein